MREQAEQRQPDEGRGARRAARPGGAAAAAPVVRGRFLGVLGGALVAARRACGRRGPACRARATAAATRRVARAGRSRGPGERRRRVRGQARPHVRGRAAGVGVGRGHRVEAVALDGTEAVRIALAAQIEQHRAGPASTKRRSSAGSESKRCQSVVPMGICHITTGSDAPADTALSQATLASTATGSAGSHQVASSASRCGESVKSTSHSPIEP